MRQRPIFLIFMATILVGVAISLPLQVMSLYGHVAGEWEAIFTKLTILNWLVFFGCLSCAVLVLQAAPVTLQALPALTGIVALNNFVVGYYAIDYSPFAALCATLGFAGINLPLIRGPLKFLIDHPDRRWWRVAKRRRLGLPIVIGLEHRPPLRTQTFDLSESGVFITLDEAALQVDEQITIRLTFGSFSQVRCQARVVRHAQAQGDHPAGYGLQFLNLDSRQRQELKRHLSMDH